MSENTGRFAQIAVLAQLGRAGGLYTYELPDAVVNVAVPGVLVSVPFSSRQLQGVICSLEKTTDHPKVRTITEVLDPSPVLTGHQLRLAEWVATYYGAPISDVVGAMLPPGLDRETVYTLSVGDDHPRSRLSEDQALVLSRVRDAGNVLIDDVQRSLPEIDVAIAVKSMLRRSLLRRTASLGSPRSRERVVRMVTPTPQGRAALENEQDWHRAPRQYAVLVKVTQLGSVPQSELTKAETGAQAAISALVRKGYVCIEEQATSLSRFLQLRVQATDPLPLSPAQSSALAAVRKSIRARKSKIFLLHGVTGSGKTEVYLQAIAETIQTGRQAIMMVPEISLTPQALERVSGRFPGKVAVLHSRLSAGQRIDEWQRIRAGEVDVVVGPRSALFAPLPRVGLIVVDEEHDPSYKQDASPRYHARDAAAVLGRMTGASVIFGSATPDIATYHAALTGRITLLELPDRPVWGNEGREPRPMPAVEIVDLRHELKAGNRSIFSAALVEALTATLAANEQALLFLNRRGSATIVLCRDCGFVARCPRCDLPFTYHSAATRLICHRCDYRSSGPRTCPACQSPRIRYLGIGTQRVEEEVRRVFPGARVLRWDRDATSRKGAHEAILHGFSRHEADILVGTQMIAKGLDFPLVTLVGVISADTGLHLPDFRAPERSFQLLTQVAGRAGRASLPSRVVVQTYTPDHYAIQAAKDHDYHRFFREEMSFRRAARYPPFARLMRFIFSSEDEAACRQNAELLRATLTEAITHVPQGELIGPAPCFTARVNNRYYWQIVCRGGAGVNGTSLHSLLDYVPPGWIVDVDPVDLL